MPTRTVTTDRMTLVVRHVGGHCSPRPRQRQVHLYYQHGRGQQLSLTLSFAIGHVQKHAFSDQSQLTAALYCISPRGYPYIKPRNFANKRRLKTRGRRGRCITAMTPLPVWDVQDVQDVRSRPRPACAARCGRRRQ